MLVTPVLGSTKQESECNRIRAIAYGMDALIPGIYFWAGSFCFRIGGTEAEEGYPGTVHSRWGFAIVFPGYRIWTTYKGDYDPRQASA